MRTVTISQLVLDFHVYPRYEVDPINVDELAEALRSGAKLPAIVCEKDTLRVVDGFHRRMAYDRVFGEQHKVEVIEKEFLLDQDFFLESIRLNAPHGRRLTNADRHRCLKIAEKWNLTAERMAKVLAITPATAMHISSIGVGLLKPATGFRPEAKGDRVSVRGTSETTEAPFRAPLMNRRNKSLREASSRDDSVDVADPDVDISMNVRGVAKQADYLNARLRIAFEAEMKK